MIYLLDANVFMNLANRAEGFEHIRARLKTLRRSQFAVSAITASELWKKTLNNKVSKRARDELAAMFNSVRVLPFGGEAAKYGGLMLVENPQVGRTIGWPDVMLAAHALALDATVVTDNTRHFKGVGCRHENWRRPNAV
jgi:tRNA(fMet)-specific endonuclease VapC